MRGDKPDCGRGAAPRGRPVSFGGSSLAKGVHSPARPLSCLHDASIRNRHGRTRQRGDSVLQVQRIEAVPPDLDALVEASLDEGFAFVARLREGWTAGDNRFDETGEALFEARADGDLVGICGLNRDPYGSDSELGRVRHLYVHPAWRARGVGRNLVTAVLTAARGHFRRVRLRTETEDASRFYDSLGFTRVENEPDATHGMALGS